MTFMKSPHRPRPRRYVNRKYRETKLLPVGLCAHVDLFSGTTRDFLKMLIKLSLITMKKQTKNNCVGEQTCWPAPVPRAQRRVPPSGSHSGPRHRGSQDDHARTFLYASRLSAVGLPGTFRPSHQDQDRASHHSQTRNALVRKADCDDNHPQLGPWGQSCTHPNIFCQD